MAAASAARRRFSDVAGLSREAASLANCPVVDWSILRRAEKAETSNPSYAAYIREAFGHGYRLSEKNWKKLYTGTFYNPAHHIREIDPAKVMMFHAKDDPNIPWRSVERFAKQTGVKPEAASARRPPQHGLHRAPLLGGDPGSSLTRDDPPNDRACARAGADRNHAAVRDFAHHMLKLNRRVVNVKARF